VNRQEFSRQLKELQSQIFHAMLSYKVYIALWPTKEVVDILNRHRGFFSPVRIALYETMIMGFAKVFDKDTRTISLINLLHEAKRNTADLVPHLSTSDLQDMEDNLLQHETIRNKIKNLRDQQLAHLDANPKPSPPPKKVEIDSIINTLEEVFNKLSSGHNESVYDWSFQKKHSATETSEVLSILQEVMEKRKAEADELLNDLGDN
jgi:hypothetical protein